MSVSNVNLQRVCPLCASCREECFRNTVLGKYEVGYYYCDTCGFLQTEVPFWLNEAYVEAIADADTGLVSRNVQLSRKLSSLLYCSFDHQGVYVDSAGGYGMLVRLMRDIGFDFYWYDEYCQNIFARGFPANRLECKVTAVTAFEVLEHVQDPLQFLVNCLQKNGADTIIFSTELFRGRPPNPSDWWYYSFETGQHISFYQLRTLQYLAKKLSLNLYSSGNFHILTERRINRLFFWLSTGRLARLGSILAKLGMKSRKFSDHFDLRNSPQAD